MSFPRYPKYKDSGVEWLGEVPEGWSIVALKFLVQMRSGESITAEAIDTEGEFPVYGGNGLRGFTSSYTHDGYFALIGRQGALCGNVNYARGRFWASEHAVVCTPLRPLEPGWLGETLRAMNLGQYSVSAAQPGLSVDAIARLKVPVPPPLEQSAIAAVLEAETGHIDSLVAEQERLIELLREKRQAVISHAVTKGLDPTVAMKDSGVEWLGEVPAHWTVGRIGYFGTVENGSTPSKDNPAYWAGGTVAWVASGEVNQGRVREATEFITKRALAESSLRVLPVGAVLVGLVGQGKTRGMSALLEIPATINQNLAAVVCGESLVPGYLHHVLATAYEYVREYGRGGQQAALNCEVLRAVRVPLPPRSEQESILVAIDQAASEHDTLITEAQRAIDLLHERRTALISAAVTGQIDVRNHQTPEQTHVGG